MRRRSKRGLLLGIGVSVWGVAAATPGRTPDRFSAIELVVGESGDAQRVGVSITIDGESHGRRWATAVERLCGFYDTDGSGALSEAESSRLPLAFDLRQMLWGRFLPGLGGGPVWGELDANRDGAATTNEVLAWYAGRGMTGVVVAWGRAPSTEALNEAIEQRVATALCRIRGRGEATDLVARFDVDNSLTITPGELVGGAIYPGAAADNLLPPSVDGFARVQDPVDLPLRWRPMPSVREGNDAPVRGPLRVAFGERALLSTDESAASEREAEVQAGSVRIQVAVVEGSSAASWRRAKKELSEQFTAAAAGGDLVAKQGDASSQNRFAAIDKLVRLADRDGGGTLDYDELSAWFNVQESLVEALTLASVLDFGAGWFEFIDASHDGALSVDEVLAAGRVVSDLKEVGRGGEFDQPPPRQLRIVFSRGVPESLLSAPKAEGPPWFQALDRNRDGVVSENEFGGSIDQFERLDANGDRVVTSAEASEVR